MAVSSFAVVVLWNDGALLLTSLAAKLCDQMVEQKAKGIPSATVPVVQSYCQSFSRHDD